MHCRSCSLLGDTVRSDLSLVHEGIDRGLVFGRCRLYRVRRRVLGWSWREREQMLAAAAAAGASADSLTGTLAGKSNGMTQFVLWVLRASKRIAPGTGTGCRWFHRIAEPGQRAVEVGSTDLWRHMRRSHARCVGSIATGVVPMPMRTILERIERIHLRRIDGGCGRYCCCRLVSQNGSRCPGGATESLVVVPTTSFRCRCHIHCAYKCPSQRFADCLDRFHYAKKSIHRPFEF